MDENSYVTHLQWGDAAPGELRAADAADDNNDEQPPFDPEDPDA
jgi:hypothetical protein